MDGCSWISSGNGCCMMPHNAEYGTCGRTTVMWPSPVYETFRSFVRFDRNGIKLSVTSSILISCGESFLMCF